MQGEATAKCTELLAGIAARRINGLNGFDDRKACLRRGGFFLGAYANRRWP